jgi:hypothetical protein
LAVSILPVQEFTDEFTGIYGRLWTVSGRRRSWCTVAPRIF